MANHTLNDLRRRYPQFIYEDFSWKTPGKDLLISFGFKIPPDISFQPTLKIENIDKARLRRIKRELIDNLVFNLGLIELLSYWKATCSREILIKCGFLTKEQIDWWKTLFIKGMGQFFFENKIDFRGPDFIKITPFSGKNNHHQNGTTPNQSSFYSDGTGQASVNWLDNLETICSPRSQTRVCTTGVVLNSLSLKNRFLVPIGGGKDSIVTLEILKEAGKETGCFSLNPTKAIEKVMKVGECQSPMIVRRRIDPKLLSLNRRGFLNGHTPFSAYLAFLGVLAAVILDYKYVAISDERSANEGNVKYLGREINHQYSKSFEFEQKIRQYCKKYLIRGVEYFSFLRPLYELQIAKSFSSYPQYFRTFLSCNQAQATKSGTTKPSGKWCGQCPKCLFVFTCLYPFLGKEKTVEIFGKNLFKDKKLLPIMKQLTGERGFKPFECVGTAKETRAALTGRGMEKILRSWSNRHNLAQGLAKTLKKHIRG
jgi:hypothetical protein